MTSIMTTNENGDMEWSANGQLHRDGGLPAVKRANGYKAWWVANYIETEVFRL